MRIRHAEMKGERQLDVAKAFIERTKQENSFFIRSFSNGEKQYKAPYGTYFTISTVNFIRALRDVLSLDRDAPSSFDAPTRYQ